MTHRDFGWIASFMGTSIGAGILFLPLSAGMGGLPVFLISLLIAAPATYLSTLIFSRYLLSSNTHYEFMEIIKASTRPWFGALISLLYFITFITLLMAYSTALNNDLGQVLFQYGATASNWSTHPLLSFLLLALMCGTIIIGERAILISMEFLTIPMIVAIFFISCMLIPYWNPAEDWYFPQWKTGLKYFLQIVPIITFTIVYYTAVSALVSTYRRSWPAESDKKMLTKKITLIITSAHGALVLFVSFFVVSCVLTLSNADVEVALKQNISVVAILAPHLTTGKWIEFMVPFIGILAIITSFMGTLLGAREGLKSILHHFAQNTRFIRSTSHDNYTIFGINADKLLTAVIGLALWPLTIMNFSISGLLGIILTPSIVFIFFILVGFLYLQSSKRRAVSYFLIIFGVFLLFSYFIGSKL